MRDPGKEPHTAARHVLPQAPAAAHALTGASRSHIPHGQVRARPVARRPGTGVVAGCQWLVASGWLPEAASCSRGRPVAAGSVTGPSSREPFSREAILPSPFETDRQQKEGIIREQEGVQPVRDGAGPVRQGRGHHRPRRGNARAAPQPDAGVLIRDPGSHGRRVREGVPRLPRPAQRRARPGQGRHPLPPARDARHGARAGDVDDVEVLGRRHPARRRQGRRDLRPAQPEPARAGGDLPRLGAPAREERRPGQRRPRART